MHMGALRAWWHDRVLPRTCCNDGQLQTGSALHSQADKRPILYVNAILSSSRSRESQGCQDCRAGLLFCSFLNKSRVQAASMTPLRLNLEATPLCVREHCFPQHLALASIKMPSKAIGWRAACKTCTEPHWEMSSSSCICDLHSHDTVHARQLIVCQVVGSSLQRQWQIKMGLHPHV